MHFKQKYHVSTEGTEYSATMEFIWLSYFFDICFREVAWIYFFLQNVDNNRCWKSKKWFYLFSYYLNTICYSLSSLPFFEIFDNVGLCIIIYIWKSTVTTEFKLLN